MVRCRHAVGIGLPPYAGVCGRYPQSKVSGRGRNHSALPLRESNVTSKRPNSQGLLTKVIGVATLSWFADILGATLGGGHVLKPNSATPNAGRGCNCSTLSSLPLSFLLPLLIVFAHEQGAPVRHIAIGASAAKLVAYSGYFMLLEQPSRPRCAIWTLLAWGPQPPGRPGQRFSSSASWEGVSESQAVSPPRESQCRRDKRR